MARSVPEWRGKDDDSAIPPRVKLRVHDRHKGVCHICNLPIKPGETWHADHVIAIIEGGPNREDNLKPAHAHCNLAKANEEKARKSKVARTRKKHVGITRPKQTIQSRGFDTSQKPERKGKKVLPPRLIYQDK